MARIYRLDDSTLFLCEDCLDSHGPVPGKWKESPLDDCSVCGDNDLQAQEEAHQWCADQDRQTWEEDQRMWEDHIAPETNNPQELK